MSHSIAIFSDLDGCLLNKEDYRFDAAIPTLRRIRELGVPLILASSKTEAEMRVIAAEMELADAPLICENGGVVFASWQATGNASNTNKHVLGEERTRILEILQGLKSRFRFRSFQDLGLEGVVEATDLPQERAAAALQRHCTEPLQWQDEEARVPEFAETLAQHSLSFTRGGRFWHVAGQTDKGLAMQWVVANLLSANSANGSSQEKDGGLREFHQPTTVAVGDSPIDQGLLDSADYPIAIPWQDGLAHVNAEGDNARVAPEPGAAGWAASVSQVLDELIDN